MAGPLKLFDAFNKGHIRRVLILTGEDAKPPTDKQWLILSGAVLHTTGTLTKVCIMYEGIVSTQPLRYVEAAGATGYYALFSTIPDAGDNDTTQAVQAQFSFMIVDAHSKISITGGTGSKVLVEVIEW